MSLTACEKADFETAHRAYQAGDYEDALKQLTILSNADDAKAQNNLGFMYLNGIGVEKNYAKALKWYRKAALHGVPEAQHSMGFIYAEGLGTAPVLSSALKWYRLAAEQGLSQAQFNLAYMYENGIGIRRDEKEVFNWYEKAAEQGILLAQYKIGSMYLNGVGVEKNQLKAYAWFGVAVAGGYEQALSPRDAIRIQLDDDQLSKARNMARELWLMHSMIEKNTTPKEGHLP
ncbi:MAG: TPR repeat protein [Gammaproteobacteria bacterium]|jgi:TPR repeat protein